MARKGVHVFENADGEVIGYGGPFQMNPEGCGGNIDRASMTRYGLRFKGFAGDIIILGVLPDRCFDEFCESINLKNNYAEFAVHLTSLQSSDHIMRLNNGWLSIGHKYADKNNKSYYLKRCTYYDREFMNVRNDVNLIPPEPIFNYEPVRDSIIAEIVKEK